MKRILLLMIALISVFAIVSCSNEDAESSSFVGLWQCDNHWYGGASVYEFKKDGTYTFTGPYNKYESGVYSYTSSTLTFSQYTGQTRTYILLSKTSRNFVIMDQDGDSYTYFKK